MHTLRQAVAAVAVLATALCGVRPAAGSEVPPAVEAAVEAGIGYLARTQNSDGSWLSDGRTGRYPVAMTALCGLSLLAGGSTCYSGPHAERVRTAVEYLLARSDPSTGLIASQGIGRPMFGHGFATTFLAQVYGSEGDRVLQARIGDALVRAVRLTASAQSERGGWYYTPDSTEDEGAVTITQMQALRACANAGIPVPQETVERALGYIEQSVNPDGGIAYRAGVPGESRPGITAAAVATLYAAGVYTGDLVENAFRFARQNVPAAAPSRSGGTHYFYSHLYLSQAMYFRGGADWEDYASAMRAWLLDAQHEDGSWEGDYIGRAYGTSVALLVLQLPYGSLPLLQR
jgi:hypothetical protein